jgi:Tol biopolymer transport system component
VPQSWSPDGAHLLFSVFNDQWTHWLMTLKDRQTKRFGDVQSIALLEGVFSQDGRWIAYQTRESGTTSNQVFVQPFPPTGAKYLVREGGHPYWSPKGNELILNVGPGRSVVIPFTATPRCKSSSS